MAVGISGQAVAQPSRTIDDFTVLQERISSTAVGTPSFDAEATADESRILGGERDLSVVKLAPNIGSASATAGVDQTGVDQFDAVLECGANVEGSIEMVWDGADGVAAIARNGLGEFDMTLGKRVNAFELIVRTASENYDLELEAFQPAPNASFFATTRESGSDTGGARLVIPFSQFGPRTVGNPVDFRRVGAFRLLSKSQAGVGNLDLGFGVLRLATNVRITMEDEILDPDRNPRPPGEPARPRDRIRYTVTIENPNDSFDLETEELVFTYNPLAPPNDNRVTYDPGSFVKIHDPPVATVIVEGNSAGDEKVTVRIPEIPDRTTPQRPPGSEIDDAFPCLDDPAGPGCSCAENPNDDGCVVFQFEVVLPDEFPPDFPMEVPGQGILTTPPGDVFEVPTDDPVQPGPEDPNLTAVASCGNAVVEDVIGEVCDDGGESADCNADCTVAACGDGVFNATAGEECDDGDDDNTNGCSNRCTLIDFDDITLGGGCGCSTGAGFGDAGVGVLAFLIGMVLWGLRRRRAAQSTALAALLAVGLAGLAGDAHAQMDDARNFSAERFTLSSDQDGILDVESGGVIGHLNWDLGFWVGLANDPLAVYDTSDGRERIDPFLTQRIGGDLVFALGFRNRFQIGVQLPVILDQNFEFMDDAFAPSSSAGIGDIRLYPKVQLIQGDVEVSLVPMITLPTAGGDSYFGEASLTFAPMIAASTKVGAFTIGGNLGYRARTNVDATLNLAPIDEMFAKLGAGYRVNPGSDKPLDLGLSVSMATAAADLFGSFNRNASETVLGANYRVSDEWNLFGGAGAGLNPGFATPDWRVLAGLRFSRRAELPLCTRDPDHPDCLCVSQPFHELCPMKCDEHPDDPRCPIAVACPDNPPNKDHDCDGVETPPWLLEPLGLPPEGPAFETPEDKAAGTPPWARISTGTPPSIDAPPEGVFPPTTLESQDYCPAEPGAAEHHGCPAPVVDIPACKQGGAPVSVSPGIAFLPGNEAVNLPSRVPLELLAARLQADPAIKISVQVGGPGANRELAEKRAAEILTFLVSRGVDGDSVVAIGVGSDDVAADAGDAAAYAVTFTRSCPELPADGPCKAVAIDKNVGIKYEVNSDAIAQTSLQMLKRDVVWVLQAHPEVQIRIEGHTSGEGALKYNMGLSQRRAESVVQFLVSEGIDASRLKAVGYGPKYQLVKPERTEADREQNRRIEFLLTAGGSCPCEGFKVEKVFFEFDSPVIKSQSFADLDQLVRNLQERPNVYLSIEGHTSSEGRAGYNKALSTRRAAAVRQYLIKRGVTARRLQSRGWGEEKLLIKDDDTDEKKETNRRVEFIVTRGADDCLPR